MPGTGKNTLTSFLRRLTNLSGNNRGLIQLRLTKDHFIDIHSMGFLNGQRPIDIVSSVAKNSSTVLCPLHDSRVESNNVVSQKLRMLQRIDRFVFEESGTNDLHIGWPYVHGKFNDGTLVRCPLIYFPVRIIQSGSTWVLEPRVDAGITFNKSFLLAYAFYQGVKVDEDLLEFSFDDGDKDFTSFRTQLYQLLQNRIEVNFNPVIFTDVLQPFTHFKRNDFDEMHGDGKLKLFPEAVLGIFPQAGSQLVPDYLHMIESDAFSDLEAFFERQHILAPTGEARMVKEEDLLAPFPLDAYQENAIIKIKSGSSIVVQGPPGTGKSQLICNLLADAIASGKKVLLVCQKKAALDVVYERLGKIGLSQFLALVHDFRNDRRDIFEKIASQIAKIEEYKTHNRSVDVIQTERKFIQICRKIDEITEELKEFKSALFDESESGVSVKELYLSSDLSRPFVNLKQEYHSFRFPVDSLVDKLRRYVLYAKKYEERGYPWRDRKSFAQLAASDEQVLHACIDSIVSLQKKISAQIFRLVGIKINLEECESLWYRHEEMLGMISLLKDDNVFSYFQRICSEPEDETSLLWLSNLERVVVNCFDEIGPEVTIPTDRLGKFQEALNERMQARGNVVRLVKWELFSENKFVVKRALVANELSYNKYGLRVLEQRIDARLNLEHHLTALKQRPWLIDIPSDYSKESLQKWFHAQKLAIRAKIIFKSLREIKDSINPASFTKKEFHALMRQILDVIKEIPSHKEEWLTCLSPFHIRMVVRDDSASIALKDTLKRDFDDLCDYDKLKDSLSETEQSLIIKLRESVEGWNINEIEKIFLNSVRLAWIEHIELKYPILRSVSSQKMAQMQQQLQELVNEKERLSLDIVLVMAKEHTYNDLSYNRLNNMVSYRDLQHQVTKRKKLWPLRKVISSFQEELFELLPCWLASPESVSALFPMEQIFDLVIFDEASQCFAEKGIPAMYRGKQVMVAGDGKQLRPSDLYQVRFTEEGSDSPDEEVESLLELAERYLPTVHLQAHYRSQSIELIGFANRHFYDNRLKLLPDRELLNKESLPIEYCKIDGVWENNVNIEEAKEVVRRLIALFEAHPGKEVGVVTFNALQQTLIQDSLEEELERLGKPLPTSLFIKNIENVQGDEKDIIVFSIGYAPDKHGKFYKQFGSLNLSGGENRLNVAVTRARENIIIITSVSPEQFGNTDQSSEGVRLLHQYLLYAREVSNRRHDILKNDVAYVSPLAAKIKEWGEERLKEYDFKLNALPHVDALVKREMDHVGAILTDDDRFYYSVSIKDAFAYTPTLLTKKNWGYKYSFTRQWWKDPSQVEESLMLFIGSRT